MIDPRETIVAEALKLLGIPCRRYEHPAAPTIAHCADIGTDIGAKHCKNLFLTNRQKTEFYLLLMCGHKQFHTASISRQIGASRLSFASPELLLEKLGLLPGAVTPFSLLMDEGRRVRVLLDEELASYGLMLFHPMVNTASYAIAYGDLMKFLVWHKNEIKMVHMEG